MATPTFTAALAQAEAMTRELFPGRTERITAATELVRSGAVFQTSDDDAHWEVDSQTTAGRRYVVNGSCTCLDDHYRGETGPCKHQLGVMIAQRTLNMLQPPPVPQTSAAPAPAPQGLPEAPVSATVKLRIGDKEVMTTLRGTDAVEVLGRMADLITRYPDAPSTSHSFAHPERTAPPPVDTPQCPQHGGMKQSTKGTGWYCPHRLDDGSWCKEKGR
jgi:hypothetical protein